MDATIWILVGLVDGVDINLLYTFIDTSLHMPKPWLLLVAYHHNERNYK